MGIIIPNFLLPKNSIEYTKFDSEYGMAAPIEISFDAIYNLFGDNSLIERISSTKTRLGTEQLKVFIAALTHGDGLLRIEEYERIRRLMLSYERVSESILHAIGDDSNRVNAYLGKHKIKLAKNIGRYYGDRSKIRESRYEQLERILSNGETTQLNPYSGVLKFSENKYIELTPRELEVITQLNSYTFQQTPRNKTRLNGIRIKMRNINLEIENNIESTHKINIMSTDTN